MNREIEILKNGRRLTSLSLGNGTFRIGRSASADIVLADGAVSKIHATLTIENETFVIKDSGSANGLFHHGKKFSEKSFDRHFEIDIRPFTVRTTSDQTAQSSDQAQRTKTRLGAFAVNNIKISLFLLFFISFFLTLIFGYATLKNQTKAVQQREILKSGVLLARYLAEINRPFLEAGQNTRVRTAPVNLEEGVIYAFVVDDHGKILAPAEKQGNFVDWPGLSAAFAEGKLTIADGTQNEKIIFYPIFDQHQLLGASLIGFAYQQIAGSASAGLGGTLFLLAAVLCSLGLVMAWLLARAFLNPLRDLNESVEIAIKKGVAAIDYQAPYGELEKLQRTFDRLLMRSAGAPPSDSSGAPTPISKSQPATRAVESPPSPSEKPALQNTTPFPVSMEKRLAELTCPWCIVNREDYTLRRMSENFAPSFGTPECREGMHIIEALGSDIIAPVSQIIDAEDAPAATLTHGEKTSVLRRLTDPKDQTAVILVFEDTTK